MQIHVEEDDWGQAQIADIHRLLLDVALQLLRHFSQPPDGRIVVQCRPNEVAPRVLYRTSPTDDYVVWLTTRDLFWCQYAYQFAHELCHILCDYERLRLTPNQWFHESLCELASIFAVKQMAATWQTAPPYANWRDFAAALDTYADELITRDEHRLPAGVSLSDWLHVNEAKLRADPYQRALNSLVAVQLLPLFQSTPEHWQAVHYMPDSNESFADFLLSWWRACPDEHKSFVSQIARLFSIDIDEVA